MFYIVFFLTIFYNYVKKDDKSLDSKEKNGEEKQDEDKSKDSDEKESIKAINLDEDSKENEEKEKRTVEQWDIKIQSMFFNLVCSCFYLISFGLFCLVLTTSGLVIYLKEYLKIDWFLLGLYGLDITFFLIMLKKNNTIFRK